MIRYFLVEELTTDEGTGCDELVWVDKGEAPIFLGPPCFACKKW